MAVAAPRPRLRRQRRRTGFPLQDGKSLAGWKAPKRPESWVVEDGVFVTRGDRSHLFYVGKVAKHDFRNFEFSAEVMTSPGANSGIYVHTKLQPAEGWPAAGYELQVINSNPPAEKMNGYIEHKMTGSIYAVRNTWIAPAKDNEWFNYRIRVVGKTIQTFINDKLICEYAEPAEALPPQGQAGTAARFGNVRAAGARSGQRREVPQHEGEDPSEGCRAAGGSRADSPIASSTSSSRRRRTTTFRSSISDWRRRDGDATAFWSEVRTPRHDAGQRSFAAEDLLTIARRCVVVIVDTRQGAGRRAAQGREGRGREGGVQLRRRHELSTRRSSKRRLQAIKDAGLGWKDFWVPGKPGSERAQETRTISRLGPPCIGAAAAHGAQQLVGLVRRHGLAEEIALARRAAQRQQL